MEIKKGQVWEPAFDVTPPLEVIDVDDSGVTYQYLEPSCSRPRVFKKTLKEFLAANQQGWTLIRAPLEIGQIWEHQGGLTSIKVVDIEGPILEFQYITSPTFETGSTEEYSLRLWAKYAHQWTLVSSSNESSKIEIEKDGIPCPGCGSIDSYYMGMFGHNCSVPHCQYHQR